jgi:acetyl esterase/lipase
VVAGDSAGGGLALALALRLQKEDIAAPAALALMSPWTDLTNSNATHRTKARVDPIFPDASVTKRWAEMYAGEQPLSNPLISPQFADASGLPPTLIHVGENEILLDDSRVFAQNMSSAGGKVTLKIYPGMWHVWQVLGGMLREADQSIAEIGLFLKSHLESTQP